MLVIYRYVLILTSNNLYQSSIFENLVFLLGTVFCFKITHVILILIVVKCLNLFLCWTLELCLRLNMWFNYKTNNCLLSMLLWCWTIWFMFYTMQLKKLELIINFSNNSKYWKKLQDSKSSENSKDSNLGTFFEFLKLERFLRFQKFWQNFWVRVFRSIPSNEHPWPRVPMN